MNKHGIVKQTENGWVIVYRKRTPHAGLSKMGTGPAASGNRGRGRIFFGEFEVPVAEESFKHCVEGKHVEFELFEVGPDGKEVFFLDDVRPFTTEMARILLYEVKPHTDWTIGLLMGEIIWCRKLKQHTETDVHSTKEEQAEYKRRSDAWFDTGHYGSNKDEVLNKKLWVEYREYARSLNIKYLPHEIEYSSFVPFDITDMDKFVRGITRFLWDTDACNYVFTKDDVTMERDACFQACHLRIKFTLNDLVEEVLVEEN